MYNVNENDNVKLAFARLKKSMQNLSDSMTELKEEFIQASETPSRKTPNEILEEVLKEKQ